MSLMNLLLLIVLVSGLIFVLRLFLYRPAMIHVVRKWGEWMDDRIHGHQQLRIPEMNENGQPNMLYRKVQLYVTSLESLEDSDFTNLFAGKKSNDILLSMDPHQTVRDTFLGATITWTNHHSHRQVQPPRIPASDSPNPSHTSNSVANNDGPSRSFVFKIKKKDKRRILRPYLQHIHAVADDIEQRLKEIKLFFLDSSGGGATSFQGRWRSIAFEHPSTFETLVMDADLKHKIKSDLDNFLKSEQYYHKLGRAWKRSYLLYGASGTGKSSFVAAMAKYLSFDVYDVDLSRVSDDSDLKLLLFQTTRKSIVVIEDLDLFVAASSLATGGVSLPGMLNFMDGILSSCCGDEKIMVFTMNHDSKHDVESAAAAMMRPGRIDVHIHFPLCDFSSFKSLANSYLGLKEHKLFPQVEEMFQSGATLSPAEIGELMLVHRSSPSRALKSVITALQSRSGGKNGRRTSESTASSPLPPLPQSEEHWGGGAWKETAPAKEFRKLYGLLRLKSSKRFGSPDQDSGLIQR